MLFGAVPFAAAPFADPGGVSVQVVLNGQQLNFAIGDVVIKGVVVLPDGERVNLATGNVTIKLGKTVLVTGEELALASSTADVITWNLIPPNANQIWIPIDPDNP
jgi:hypothetical protein